MSSIESNYTVESGTSFIRCGITTLRFRLSTRWNHKQQNERQNDFYELAQNMNFIGICFQPTKYLSQKLNLIYLYLSLALIPADIMNRPFDKLIKRLASAQRNFAIVFFKHFHFLCNQVFRRALIRSESREKY